METSRRQLICQGCAWAATGLAAGCAVGGVGGGPNGGGGTQDGTDPVDTGSDDPFATTEGSTGIDAACAVAAEPGGAGWAELPLDTFPELDVVGGWVQTNVGGVTLNVAHIEDGCFVAMETRCTHEGAEVTYRPDRQQFVCTLHGAVYVADGEPIAGPTSVALATYPAARAGGSVWVQVG